MEISAGTIISFVLYMVGMLGIGFYFYDRKSDVEKYLLGGRGLGGWVTAMSAQAVTCRAG